MTSPLASLASTVSSSSTAQSMQPEISHSDGTTVVAARFDDVSMWGDDEQAYSIQVEPASSTLPGIPRFVCRPQGWTTCASLLAHLENVQKSLNYDMTAETALRLLTLPKLVLTSPARGGRKHN